MAGALVDANQSINRKLLEDGKDAINSTSRVKDFPGGGSDAGYDATDGDAEANDGGKGEIDDGAGNAEDGSDNSHEMGGDANEDSWVQRQPRCLGLPMKKGRADLLACTETASWRMVA